MNSSTAEQILALAHELKTSQELARRIAHDLPRLLKNMTADVEAAWNFTASAQVELGDQDEWARRHLGEL